MPARRKPAADRQDRRPSRALAAVPAPDQASSAPAVPPFRARWLPATREGWRSFWASEVAAATTPADHPMIFRLFDLRDAQTLALARYATEPVVLGSQGQPRSNPALADALALEREVRALEDRVGLSPKSRANLGYALGQARLTASHLNEQARRAVSRDLHHDADAATDADADGAAVAGWEAAP